jgi:hypothetical protein
VNSALTIAYFTMFHVKQFTWRTMLIQAEPQVGLNTGNESLRVKFSQVAANNSLIIPVQLRR